MIHPITIAKCIAHLVNGLLRDLAVSISPLPKASVQIKAIAPVEIAATHPWERSAQVHPPELEQRAEVYAIWELPSLFVELLGPEAELEAEAELEIGI